MAQGKATFVSLLSLVQRETPVISETSTSRVNKAWPTYQRILPLSFLKKFGWEKPWRWLVSPRQELKFTEPYRWCNPFGFVVSIIMPHVWHAPFISPWATHHTSGESLHLALIGTSQLTSHQDHLALLTFQMPTIEGWARRDSKSESIIHSSTLLLIH